MYIGLGLVTIVLVAAAACGGAEAPTPTRGTTPTSAPTATATFAATPTSPPTATATVAATPTSPPAQPTGAEMGKSLAARKGCAACHSIDGSATIGPTWLGLYGKEETLADGSIVVADEAYLHESIVDPDTKIVKGFSAGIMPGGFSDLLSEEQIQAIIEYIKTVQ